MYHPGRVRQAELLQLLLLDTIYAQSCSKDIIFQGGTALRWVYGGVRFSEDLDFVTHLSLRQIRTLLANLVNPMQKACIAQFGPGVAEQKIKSNRPSALKAFFIYRPNSQRERIAVKLEFERLIPESRPKNEPFILNELAQVAGLIASGHLFMPYSSSVIVAESLQEILSDKIRALFERTYLKGRDVYDFWWLTTQLDVGIEWASVRKKLAMYRVPFISARPADFFQTKIGLAALADALQSDLPRFIPPRVLSVYQHEHFARIIAPLRQLSIDMAKKDIIEHSMSSIAGKEC